MAHALVSSVQPSALRARQKFLHYFPGGFADETYLEWERNYKWAAHERWQSQLGRSDFRSLLTRGEHHEIARRAVAIESRTNLLFSFEKMALRDAVRSPQAARRFATALYELIHRPGGSMQRAFERWIEAIDSLPRRQTRVLTWPLVTVFGFLADPKTHIFLKPNVTRIAAKKYGYDFSYRSRPNWETYASYFTFAETIRRDNRAIASLRPRDLIDLQSFIWVQGSDEYPD